MTQFDQPATTGEAHYDAAGDTALTMIAPADVPSTPLAEAPTDGMGCHAGAATMQEAARAAGNSQLLDQYAADYPQGPHDKPQSMCPAFGSLRVGLRMRRVATVLSGSACCVYGLTFVSHFYGARRSVGYVPFNSESLVTGKLFEDIRDAVHELADPERYDAIVVTNLCVPTASGVITIEVRSLRETRTAYDPEVLEREIRPMCQRRAVLPEVNSEQ